MNQSSSYQSVIVAFLRLQQSPTGSQMLMWLHFSASSSRFCDCFILNIMHDSNCLHFFSLSIPNICSFFPTFLHYSVHTAIKLCVKKSKKGLLTFLYSSALSLCFYSHVKFSLKFRELLTSLSLWFYCHSSVSSFFHFIMI